MKTLMLSLGLMAGLFTSSLQSQPFGNETEDCSHCGPGIEGMPGNGIETVLEVAMAAQPPADRVINNRVIGELCVAWTNQNWDAFTAKLAEEGLTVSEVYYNLKCNGSGQENLSILRLAMESPVDYWTEANKLHRLFNRDEGIQGRNTMTCAIASIQEDNKHLVEFIEHKIAVTRSDLDRTVNPITNEDERTGLERAIRAWERRLGEYRDHLRTYSNEDNLTDNQYLENAVNQAGCSSRQWVRFEADTETTSS